MVKSRPKPAQLNLYQIDDRDMLQVIEDINIIKSGIKPY